MSKTRQRARAARRKGGAVPKQSNPYGDRVPRLTAFGRTLTEYKLWPTAEEHGEVLAAMDAVINPVLRELFGDRGSPDNYSVEERDTAYEIVERRGMCNQEWLDFIEFCDFIKAPLRPNMANLPTR